MSFRPHLRTLGMAAAFAAYCSFAGATVITFNDSPNPANNTDLAPTYGSNVAVATTAFTDGGEGMTPNIALLWAPTGGTVANGPDIDVLEYHSAGTFTNVAGPAFTAPVLQLDVDLSNHSALPADPTIDFLPSAGVAVRVHEFKIGNATDQGEPAYSWTVNLVRLSDMATVASQSTAPMVAGNSEILSFNYTGSPGVGYRLVFDDHGANAVRTAIDNIRFSQVAVPEPAALALIAIGGAGMVWRRRR